MIRPTKNRKKNHFANDVKPLISKRADGVGFKQTKTSQMFSQLDSLLTLRGRRLSVKTEICDRRRQGARWERTLHIGIMIKMVAF